MFLFLAGWSVGWSVRSSVGLALVVPCYNVVGCSLLVVPCYNVVVPWYHYIVRCSLLKRAVCSRNVVVLLVVILPVTLVVIIVVVVVVVVLVVVEAYA